MIDRDWITQAIRISGAGMAPDEIPRLSIELGDEAELLPYLLLNTGAFSDWPQAHGAIREAVRAVIWRRAQPHGRGGSNAAERELLSGALHDFLVPRETKKDDETIDVAAAINRFRFRQSTKSMDPRAFLP